MNLIDVIILSIVEGFTEFLPISSTAHLILFSKLLNLSINNENILFIIFIQSGALLAVISKYYKEILNKDLLIKIFISFIPIGILGYIVNKYLKYIFNNILIIIFTTIFFGIIFLFLDKIEKIFYKNKNIKNLSHKDSLIIGLFQALSILPGTSRSGASILGGIFCGLNKKDAVKYSFLLGIPTLFIASIYLLIKNIHSLTVDNYLDLFLGFILSYIFAKISIEWLLKYIKTHDFKLFGIYRIFLGLALLFMYIFLK